jgi:hypothetical protein
MDVCMRQIGRAPGESVDVVVSKRRRGFVG